MLAMATSAGEVSCNANVVSFVNIITLFCCIYALLYAVNYVLLTQLPVSLLLVLFCFVVGNCMRLLFVCARVVLYRRSTAPRTYFRSQLYATCNFNNAANLITTSPNRCQYIMSILVSLHAVATLFFGSTFILFAIAISWNIIFHFSFHHWVHHFRS